MWPSNLNLSNFSYLNSKSPKLASEKASPNVANNEYKNTRQSSDSNNSHFMFNVRVHSCISSLSYNTFNNEFILKILCDMLKTHPGLFKLNKKIDSNGNNGKKFFRNWKNKQAYLSKLFILDYVNKSQCLICLAKFDMDDFYTSLNCEHTFHILCIQTWLSKVFILLFLFLS